MTRAIEIFAIIHLTVMGVSHIVQHRVWAEFFERLSALGRVGVFCNAGIHFLFGSLIVAFHNVWTGIPAVLTVLGWALCLKAAIYFCAPSIGLRSMRLASVEKSRRFIPAGFGLIALAALFAFGLSD